jgi:hypothetical protein
MEMEFDLHLGYPVTERINDAANHHLGKNRVCLEGLLVCRPVVLRHVAQDLKDGPALHAIQSNPIESRTNPKQRSLGDQEQQLEGGMKEEVRTCQ